MFNDDNLTIGRQWISLLPVEHSLLELIPLLGMVRGREDYIKIYYQLKELMPERLLKDLFADLGNRRICLLIHHILYVYSASLNTARSLSTLRSHTQHNSTSHSATQHYTAALSTAHAIH